MLSTLCCTHCVLLYFLPTVPSIECARFPMIVYLNSVVILWNRNYSFRCYDINFRQAPVSADVLFSLPLLAESVDHPIG